MLFELISTKSCTQSYFKKQALRLKGEWLFLLFAALEKGGTKSNHEVLTNPGGGGEETSSQIGSLKKVQTS